DSFSQSKNPAERVRQRRNDGTDPIHFELYIHEIFKSFWHVQCPTHCFNAFTIRLKIKVRRTRGAHPAQILLKRGMGTIGPGSHRLCCMSGLGSAMLTRGLEPPRVAPYGPEPYASASSATRAKTAGLTMRVWQRACKLKSKTSQRNSARPFLARVYL